MKYVFFNPAARTVVVWGRNLDDAWQRLQRTHAYYFTRGGWRLLSRKGGAR